MGKGRLRTRTDMAKALICCCCGGQAIGRQWWNRDKGYGVCVKCSKSIAKKETPEYMKECYGERGYHYDITWRGDKAPCK